MKWVKTYRLVLKELIMQFRVAFALFEKFEALHHRASMQLFRECRDLVYVQGSIEDSRINNTILCLKTITHNFYTL